MDSTHLHHALVRDTLLNIDVFHLDKLPLENALGVDTPL